jgi:hypothetical protein
MRIKILSGARKLSWFVAHDLSDLGRFKRKFKAVMDTYPTDLSVTALTSCIYPSLIKVHEFL